MRILNGNLKPSSMARRSSGHVNFAPKGLHLTGLNMAIYAIVIAGIVAITWMLVVLSCAVVG